MRQLVRWWNRYYDMLFGWGTRRKRMDLEDMPPPFSGESHKTSDPED